jgi:hypothetical protein
VRDVRSRLAVDGWSLLPMDARSGLLAVDGWSWLPMDARPGLAVDVPQGLAVGVRPLTDASGRPFVAVTAGGRLGEA